MGQPQLHAEARHSAARPGRRRRGQPAVSRSSTSNSSTGAALMDQSKQWPPTVVLVREPLLHKGFRGMLRGFEARRWRSSHLNRRPWWRGFVTGLTALLNQRTSLALLAPQPTTVVAGFRDGPDGSPQPASIAGAPRTSTSKDALGVHPPDAAADDRQVGTVDVQRDGGRVTGVVHAVDVARWHQPRHVTGERDRRAGHDQVAVGGEAVARLVLRALIDADDAPGQVVVDRGGLSREPDEGDQGEGAVRVRRRAGATGTPRGRRRAAPAAAARSW